MTLEQNSNRDFLFNYLHETDLLCKSESKVYSIYHIENVKNIIARYTFTIFFIMCFGAVFEHYGCPKLNPDWKPHISTPCLNVYFIMTENPLSQCLHVTNK